MILNIQNIYIKYLDQVKKVYKKCNKIYICTLKLEQKLYTSNKKLKKVVFLLAIDFKNQII